MIQEYMGHYPYQKNIINDWNSSVIGVYYLGYLLQNGNLFPLYVGKATGKGGIRERLLQHLRDDNWGAVTHFGYAICSSEVEAVSFESTEIKRLQPDLNEIGK